jgi:hypothetical protein
MVLFLELPRSERENTSRMSFKHNWSSGCVWVILAQAPDLDAAVDHAADELVAMQEQRVHEVVGLDLSNRASGRSTSKMDSFDRVT